MFTLPARVHLVGIFLVLISVCTAWAQGVPDVRSQAENLTVMIEARFKGEPLPEWGSGIIVGQRDKSLFIATATHVVKQGTTQANIKVFLRWLPRDSVGGLIARVVQTSGDLAVLELDLLPTQIPPRDVLLFAALASPNSLSMSDGVRALGYPRGDPWGSCLTPDAFERQIGDSIIFESKCIQPGHSGGPLLDEDWRIVGMVHRDQQPAGIAKDITASLALIKSWGVPVDLESTVPQDENRFTSVTVGTGITCGLSVRSRIYCWGSNANSALGAGTERTFNASVAIPVFGRHRYSNVSAGGQYGCGITLGAMILCWGDVPGYAAGARPIAISETTPSFVTISAGAYHACVISADANAYCWGFNHSGQLGDGSTKGSASLVRVSGSHTWKQISVGTTITCGIASNSKAYCWGDNISKIVAANQERVVTPTSIDSDLSWRQISAGGRRDIGGDGTKFVCAVAENKRAYCWGTDARKMLLAPPGATDSTPIEVDANYEFSSISSGQHHACGVLIDGRVVCWGRSRWGEAGKVDADKRARQISGIQDAEYVAANDETSCVLRKSGRIYCWGYDSHRLGIGGSPVIGGTAQPEYPVRVSKCDQPMSATVPRELSTSRQLQLDYIISDLKSVTQAPFFAALKRARDAVQITRGQLLACEKAPNLDKSIAALSKLYQLEQELSSLQRSYIFSTDSEREKQEKENDLKMDDIRSRYIPVAMELSNYE